MAADSEEIAAYERDDDDLRELEKRAEALRNSVLH